MQLLVGQDGRYSCTWQLDGAQYTYLRELLETERTGGSVASLSTRTAIGSRRTKLLDGPAARL